jgi:hypothetical protein
MDWDPTVLDHTLDDDNEWFDAVSDLQNDPTTNLFDEFGNYRKRTVVVEENDTFFDTVAVATAVTSEMPNIDHIIDDCILHRNIGLYEAHAREVKTKEPDYGALRPLFFGWLPIDVIKRIFAADVHRRDEPVATDIVYSDTPAVDSGATSAQLFVGTETLLTDVYGMKTDKKFVNTLEDNIQERGAMPKLISDQTQVEISNKVTDTLRALFISSWQSEPHQQHQNYAENRYQTVKTMGNTILDRTGAPTYTWLLCLTYVCVIHNFTVSSALHGGVPIQRATGSTNAPLVLPTRHWFYQL